MIEVTCLRRGFGRQAEQGQVLYKTEHNRLGRFPEAASEDLLAGPKRNFQVFDPLDFLAEVTCLRRGFGRQAEQGQGLYETEHNRLGRFPEAASDDLVAGPKRNFQVFDPLDFLAEVTQHIPDPGEHLIRYCGFYSNKSRGLRAHAQAQPGAATVPKDNMGWSGWEKFGNLTTPCYLYDSRA